MGNSHGVVKFRKEHYSVEKLITHSRRSTLLPKYYVQLFDVDSKWEENGKVLKWKEILDNIENYPEIKKLIFDANDSSPIIAFASEKYIIEDVISGHYTLLKLHLKNKGKKVPISIYWLRKNELDKCNINTVS